MAGCGILTGFAGVQAVTQGGTAMQAAEQKRSNKFWPNDPLFEQQWSLHMLGFPEVWEIQRGSPAVKVAVIETGMDPTHPDLQAAMLEPIALWDSWGNPRDDEHGTHMCGIIAAQIDNDLGQGCVALLPVVAFCLSAVTRTTTSIWREAFARR